MQAGRSALHGQGNTEAPKADVGGIQKDHDGHRVSLVVCALRSLVIRTVANEAGIRRLPMMTSLLLHLPGCDCASSRHTTNATPSVKPAITACMPSWGHTSSAALAKLLPTAPQPI